MNVMLVFVMLIGLINANEFKESIVIGISDKKGEEYNFKDSNCFSYYSNKGKCYNRGSKIPVTLIFSNDAYVGNKVNIEILLKCFDCKKPIQGTYSNLQTTEPVVKGKKYGINIIVPNEAEFSDQYYLQINTDVSGSNQCSGESVGDYFSVSEEKCSGAILNVILLLSLSLLMMI